MLLGLDQEVRNFRIHKPEFEEEMQAAIKLYITNECKSQKLYIYIPLITAVVMQQWDRQLLLMLEVR